MAPGSVAHARNTFPANTPRAEDWIPAGAAAAPAKPDCIKHDLAFLQLRTGYLGACSQARHQEQPTFTLLQADPPFTRHIMLAKPPNAVYF